MLEDLTLRTARDEDLGFLFELLKAALGPYVEATFGAWKEEEQRARFFATTVPEAHQVVELDGRPIGCLLVTRNAEEIRLQRMFLLPEFQGRGIGTHLVEQLIAEARQAGLPLRLRVFHVNPAQRLYRRLGFAVTGETETHVLMAYDPHR